MQQSLERQRTAEKERLFLVYAKQWWREFLEIRPSHQSKMVKIFAQVRLKSDNLHLATDALVSNNNVHVHLPLCVHCAG